MSEPSNLVNFVTDDKRKMYDLINAPLSADPLAQIVRGTKHTRNHQFNIRVDENEQRWVHALRRFYEETHGESRSDQDVIRGMIKYVGKRLLDDGVLDNWREVPELRVMARIEQAKTQARLMRQQRDALSRAVEEVTQEVEDRVRDGLMARAYRSIEDFLALLVETVAREPEDAAFALGIIRQKSGFMDAIAKMQAAGYEISLPDDPA